jgi:NTP pyrophosphatase (non-canonical NTP hydrolase)
MNLKDYGDQAITTMTSAQSYGDISPQFMDQILGLVGESSEVAEKMKKIIRDKAGVISPEDRAEIIKELGDILWYVNSVAHMLDSSFEEVASKNLEKVLSRKARGTLHGTGDNR